MVDRIIKFFTSLRLTVALLCAAIVLVFIGTLAQVHEGLYFAQDRYFKSWLVLQPTIGQWKWPIVLPGGYLIGTALLINLISAHIKRFQFTTKKIGIQLTHIGLILLILGQLLTDLFSTESALRLAEGEARNYSVDFHENELVVIDTSDTAHDQVVSIPEKLVAKEGEVRHEKMPVTLRVLRYWPNADLTNVPVPNSIRVEATRGFGLGQYLVPRPLVVSMDERNIPSALVEIIGPQGSLGTWLLSSLSAVKQEFSIGAKAYEIALRFTRHYKPFTIKLLEFTHDKYRGTEKPKNFASRIRLQRPATGEDREVVIYMNNPLRYGGETYYQASFAPDNDKRTNKVTILQVVRNPSWLAPYFACAVMALGMIIQFSMHLSAFAGKRKTA